MAKKQTAGRDRLGKLSPKFAELNDDVLFGEVWSREAELSARDRSMVTIAALFSAGLYPQLKSHLALGKEHDITKKEAVEVVTQLAFYCGWPKAWSAFPLIAEVYGEEESSSDVPSQLSAFPIGEPNTAFSQYFIGQSYLAPLTAEQIPTVNVTFEPACRNNWHYSSCKVRRRADADLRQRARLVSGVGKETAGTAPGRCGEYLGECKALAWRGEKFLVPAYCSGGSR